MTTIEIIERVDCSEEAQAQLAVIFAKDPKRPLSRSTVSNYLNKTRYPYPKAEKVRQFAVEHLGGIWVTDQKVRR